MVKVLSKEKKEELELFLTKGRRNKSNGYIILKLGKGKTEKRIKRSRAYYQYLNRVELTINEIIHHVDGNKENDDIRNLELQTLEEHASSTKKHKKH